MHFLATAFELYVTEVLLLVAPEFQIRFLKDLNCDAVVEVENDDVKGTNKRLGRKWQMLSYRSLWIYAIRCVKGISEQCWLAVQLGRPAFYCV